MRTAFAFAATMLALLAGGPATATAGPEIYDVATSPVGYQLPQPLPMVYVVWCDSRVGRCAHNAVSLRARDADSPSVAIRFEVVDADDRVVYTEGWDASRHRATTDGKLTHIFWTPRHTFYPGSYRFRLQARDDEGNVSPWVVSEPVVYV